MRFRGPAPSPRSPTRHCQAVTPAVSHANGGFSGRDASHPVSKRQLCEKLAPMACAWHSLDIDRLQRLEIQTEPEERIPVGTVERGLAEALVVIGVEERIVGVPEVVVQVRSKASLESLKICDAGKG